jgi:alpha-beta hydrolase superfamily lysophospholipase
MFWWKKTSIAAVSQPGARMKFYKTQTHTDTVVFVHGILGHYINTWGLFPKLLSEDADLPELDVLLWGYRTGWIKRHHGLKYEGQHFVTALQTLIRPNNELVLVGHSMGGLIILRGLVDRMILGHAQGAPCKSVSWITLFATPLNGAWTAGVVRIVVNPMLRLVGTLYKHLRDLSRGAFCDALMAEVVNRIYRPTIEDTANRKIPIRIVAATRDGAVDRANRDATLALYRDPEALQLDEDHSSVKLPTYVGDVRYRVLFNDIQIGFARKFASLCASAIDPAATVDQREAALSEILQRYQNIIRRRVRDVVNRIDLYESAETEFLLLMAFDGAKRNLPPFDAANRAMVVLAARHKNWR